MPLPYESIDIPLSRPYQADPAADTEAAVRVRLQDGRIALRSVRPGGNEFEFLRVQFYPEDAEAVIHAIRWMAAGPLGRLAMETPNDEARAPEG